MNPAWRRLPLDDPGGTACLGASSAPRGGDDALGRGQLANVAENGFYLCSPIAVSNGRLLLGADHDDEGGTSTRYVPSTAAKP